MYRSNGTKGKKKIGTIIINVDGCTKDSYVVWGTINNGIAEIEFNIPPRHYPILETLSKDLNKENIEHGVFWKSTKWGDYKKVLIKVDITKDDIDEVFNKLTNIVFKTTVTTAINLERDGNAFLKTFLLDKL